MSTKNARTLGIRLDDKEASALQEINDTIGLAPVSALRIALKALIKRWQEKKRLVLPFHVLGDDEFAELKASRPEIHGLNAPKPGEVSSEPPLRAPVPVVYPKPKRRSSGGGGGGFRHAADEHHKDEGHDGL